MSRHRNNQFFIYLPFGVRLRRHNTVQAVRRTLFLVALTGVLVFGLVYALNA